MKYWDNLHLSWNNNDYLGCIIPSKENEYCIFNGRRFIQRPGLHWCDVHDTKLKPRQKKQPLISAVPATTNDISGPSKRTWQLSPRHLPRSLKEIVLRVDIRRKSHL